jgi:hypothetical protein
VVEITGFLVSMDKQIIFVDIECEKCHNHIHGAIEKGYFFGCPKCSSILEIERSLSISERILVLFGREINKVGHVVTVSIGE